MPTLLLPVNDATNMPLTPILDWGDVYGALSYWIQVADNPSISNPIINNQSIPVSQLPISSGLNNNTTYYWHVIAANSGGNSPWSETRKFTTAVGNLTAPNLVAPGNGATGQSVTPLLDWTDVSGASYYTVQVDISTAFNDPNQYVSQSSLTTSQYQVPKGRLSANKQYFWRVFSQNSDGRIAKCSDVFHFTTGSYQAPNPPQLGSPGDGATGQDLNTDLNWSYIENATSYHLQVSQTSDFHNIIIDQSGISVSEYSIPMGKLTYFTTYYWRVDASNSLGTSDWSEIRSFTTLPQQKPAVPMLLSPANNAIDQPLTPTLDWSDVSGADKYRLQVSKNADFSDLVIDFENLTSSQNPTSVGTLNNYTTYYWRVFASNTGGNSDWSDTWSFKTIIASSPPIAPSLITPVNNAASQSLALTLVWSDVIGAISYGFQLAMNLDFTNIIVDVSELSSSQYTIPNSILFYKTQYYWRVNASNQAGTSAWSQLFSFVTETQPIIQPPSASTIVGMGQVYDVKVLNQYAYCLSEVGFFRINIEDPYNIFVKHKIVLPSGFTIFSKFVLSEGYAYIGNGSSGVTIVNISNPDFLSIASTVSSI